MKQIFAAIICVLVGLAAGGGGVYAYTQSASGGKKESAGRPDPAGENEMLPPFKVRAPITFDDGTLATYAVFKVQLVVKAETAEKAEAAEAMVINGINMRTFKTPLVKGADGQIADVEAFRKVVSEASNEALGKGVLVNILITDVQPDQTGPLD